MFKKTKCYLCGKKDLKENMACVQYGIYYDDIRYYHDKCLKEIILNPEEYDTRTVDKAIWCFENQEANKQKKKEQQEKREQKLDKILSQIVKESE